MHHCAFSGGKNDPNRIEYLSNIRSSSLNSGNFIPLWREEIYSLLISSLAEHFGERCEDLCKWRIAVWDSSRTCSRNFLNYFMPTILADDQWRRPQFEPERSEKNNLSSDSEQILGIRGNAWDVFLFLFWEGFVIFLSFPPLSLLWGFSLAPNLVCEVCRSRFACIVCHQKPNLNFTRILGGLVFYWEFGSFNLNAVANSKMDFIEIL